MEPCLLVGSGEAPRDLKDAGKRLDERVVGALEVIPISGIEGVLQGSHVGAGVDHAFLLQHVHQQGKGIDGPVGRVRDLVGVDYVIC